MARRPLTEVEKRDAATLSALVTADGRSQMELSNLCGWKTQGALSQYVLGTIPLNLHAAAKIARVLNVSVRDFSERLAEEQRDLADTYESIDESPDQRSLKPRVTRPDTYPVPRLDVRASMGDGIDIMENVDIIDYVEINVPELCRARGVSVSTPSNLRIVTGFGNSMRPLFEHGDRLLVDCGVTDLRFDDVYCLEDDERLYIKRMQKVPGKPGVYMMKSDNKDYDSFEIADPIKSGFKVLGRVVAALNINKV